MTTTPTLPPRLALPRSACGFGHLRDCSAWRPRTAGAATPDPGPSARRSRPEAAALPGAGQAGDLPVHARRGLARRHVRPQAEADGDERPAAADRQAASSSSRRRATCWRRPGSSDSTGRAGSRSATCSRRSARASTTSASSARCTAATRCRTGRRCLNINTGSGVFARPSLGAWTLYGLGTENQNLPGFVSLSPSLYHGGAQNYGSAFLPATYQGTRIGDGSTHFKRGQAVEPLARRRPRGCSGCSSTCSRGGIAQHLARVGEDPRLEARIAAFEMAFRMQAEAPGVMDLGRESAATQALYGVGAEPTDEYARQCLLARRLPRGRRPVRPGQLQLSAELLGRPRRPRATTIRAMPGRSTSRSPRC